MAFSKRVSQPVRMMSGGDLFPGFLCGGDSRRAILPLRPQVGAVLRWERITLDGDHFCIDLVFYHTVLNRYSMYFLSRVV